MPRKEGTTAKTESKTIHTITTTHDGVVLTVELDELGIAVGTVSVRDSQDAIYVALPAIEEFVNAIHGMRARIQSS